jgi:hypothetical protein
MNNICNNPFFLLKVLNYHANIENDLVSNSG